MAQKHYAPPPKVGQEFRGPRISGPSMRGRYVVAAIVDLGFYDNDPTYYQVVFRFWAGHKGRYAWEIVGADAIDLRLYTPVPAKVAKGPKPKVGDSIYIGPGGALGGLAKISEVKIGVSAGEPTWFICVKGLPGHSYNYPILLETQATLKKEFGRKRAKPDYG